MAENVILLFNDNHVDWGVQKLDDAWDFKEIIKNPIIGTAVEAVDGRGARIGINFLNKRVSPHIPDEYKDEVHIALDDCIDGDKDYSEAAMQVIEVLDQLKDKLNVSDFVKSLIDSAIELMKGAVLSVLEKE